MLTFFLARHYRASVNFFYEKKWNSLEILIFDELNNNVFFWLNLQHLQREAEERSGLYVSSKNSTDVLQLHRFVNNKLSYGSQQALISDKLHTKNVGSLLHAVALRFVRKFSNSTCKCQANVFREAALHFLSFVVKHITKIYFKEFENVMILVSKFNLKSPICLTMLNQINILVFLASVRQKEQLTLRLQQ